MFTCANGECIRDVYVCDGDSDCTDGDDEVSCGIYNFLICYILKIFIC